MPQTASPAQTDPITHQTTTADTADAAITSLLSCPRCDYDLSGNRADWTDAACAMTSVCSECGLRFFWGDLLNENLRTVPWLYEHARRWWNLRAAWSTAIRAMIPWHFWKRVRLHHRVVPRRLTLFPLVLFLTIFGPYVLIVAATGALELYAAAQPLPKTLYAGVSNFYSRDSDATVALSSDQSSVTITSEGVSAAVPVSPHLIVDPEFHPDTAVGKVLLVWSSNVGGWTFPRTTFLPDGVTEFDSDAPGAIDQLQDLIDIRYARSPDGEMYDDVLLVVLIPPNRSLYTTWRNAFVGPLLTPLGVSIRWYEDYAAAIGLNNFDTSPPFILLFFIGFPVLIIAVCPSEWRKAKVRWVHLLRIGVIALAPAIIVTIFPLVVYSWNNVAFALWTLRGGMINIPGRRGPNFIATPLWLQHLTMTSTWLFTLGVITLWAPIYFWFALRRGMELRRPIYLWILACTVSWLGVFTALTAMDRYLP